MHIINLFDVSWSFQKVSHAYDSDGSNGADGESAKGTASDPGK